MKLQFANLFALAIMPALTFAAPHNSYLEIDIKAGPDHHVQMPVTHVLKLGDPCQPQTALCMETPFKLLCCAGLHCDSPYGGKCVSDGDMAAKDKNQDNKESKTKEGNVHAMCRPEGEFCQLVPLPLACCPGMTCTSIFGGNCVKN